MGYMTFEQQTKLHLEFLRQAGLEVTDLIIDSEKFIRSCAKGEEGRGEYAYKTISKVLNNGLIGLMTWCRGEKGQVSSYKTYGSSKEGRSTQNVLSDEKTHFGVDLNKIQIFWDLSSTEGESDYLKRKGVKSYRIRFRENQYGKVAVVPMTDIYGQLKGYQLLNADSSKIFAKGIRVNGLFHQLTDLKDNVAIGIAESYVTAATCYELLPMPMVTAFTGDNLEHIAEALRECYPNSPLVIFADNDKHLFENKGMLSAMKALEKAKGNGIILAPRFEEEAKGRAYTDWNDLVREVGLVSASEQIWEGLQQTQDERIKTYYI